MSHFVKRQLGIQGFRGEAGESGPKGWSRGPSSVEKHMEIHSVTSNNVTNFAPQVTEALPDFKDLKVCTTSVCTTSCFSSPVRSVNVPNCILSTFFSGETGDTGLRGVKGR